MRLDKYLAETAQCTRSEAKTLLQKGRVTVNGAVCKKGDTQLKDSDTVAVDGQPLAYQQFVYLMLNVTDGIVVYPKVIRSRLMAELPFMASENIMMQAVEKGGNRQELHERLRQHAIAAGKQVKEEGLPNDMVDRVAADPAFGLTKEEIVAGLVPENFVGRAPQQVDEFIAHILKPIFDANPDAVEQHASLSV